MKLLWAREHNDVEEWAASDPHGAFVLRRCCLVASSWIFYRFVQQVSAWPWLLAGVVDHRRPEAERRLVAQSFVDSPTQMLDQWFSLRMHGQVEDVDELFAERWQRALYLWTWQIQTTIAQTEFAHGRNRRRVDPSETWPSFAAHSYNSETSLRLQAQHKALSATNVAARQAPPRPKRASKARAFSPLDILRFELKDAKQLAGQKVRVASKEFWDEVKAEWADAQADPARMERLTLEAATRSEARAGDEAIVERPAEHPDGGRDVQVRRACRPAIICPPVDLTGLASAEPVHCESLDDMRCPINSTSECTLALSGGKFAAALGSGASKETLLRKESKFRAVHARMARNAHVDPGKVPPPPRWTPSPQGEDDFRCLLEEQLRAYLKRILTDGASKSISRVHSKNVILKVRVIYLNADGTLGGDEAIVFLVATSGNAQAGAVPFRMNLALLEYVSDDDDTLFVLSRNDLIHTRRRLPWVHVDGCGMLSHYGYQDLAATVLEPLHDCDAHSVEVTKIKCSLVGCDRYRVHGVDDSAERLVVSRDGLDGGVKHDDGAGGGPDDGGCAADEDDVDLLLKQLVLHTAQAAFPEY